MTHAQTQTQTKKLSPLLLSLLLAACGGGDPEPTLDENGCLPGYVYRQIGTQVFRDDPTSPKFGTSEPIMACILPHEGF